MTKLNELAYQARNVMDAICTVEVAFDAAHTTIHIFDTQQAVEPEYNFATKQFVLSEAFWPMAETLAAKGFLPMYDTETTADWVARITWHFYSSKQTIKTFENAVMTTVMAHSVMQNEHENYNEKAYYHRYVKKLLPSIN